jgi:excisionase family DNA binding protein
MTSDNLTVREAAKRLGLQESTIRKWILQRKVGVVRLGRAVRLRAADLDRMLSEAYRPPVVGVNEGYREDVQ